MERTVNPQWTILSLKSRDSHSHPFCNYDLSYHGKCMEEQPSGNNSWHCLLTVKSSLFLWFTAEESESFRVSTFIRSKKLLNCHSFPREKFKVTFHSHHLLLSYLAESNGLLYCHIPVQPICCSMRFPLHWINILNFSNLFLQCSLDNYLPHCINM